MAFSDRHPVIDQKVGDFLAGVSRPCEKPDLTAKQRAAALQAIEAMTLRPAAA